MGTYVLHEHMFPCQPGSQSLQKQGFSAVPTPLDARLRGAMGRPPKDDDATKNLKPEDKTQRAKAGTKIGLLRRADVLRDFAKVARRKS
jgi:hypothetical protein